MNLGKTINRGLKSLIAARNFMEEKAYYEAHVCATTAIGYLAEADFKLSGFGQHYRILQDTVSDYIIEAKKLSELADSARREPSKKDV